MSMSNDLLQKHMFLVFAGGLGQAHPKCLETRQASSNAPACSTSNPFCPWFFSAQVDIFSLPLTYWVTLGKLLKALVLHLSNIPLAQC